MANITTTLQRDLKKLARMKDQAVKGLHRTLRTIEAERKKRTADLDDAAKAVHRQLAEWGFTNGSVKRKAKSSPKKTTKKSKGRRSSADMKAEAERMVKFIKAKGKDGASGADIKKEFGPYQSVKGFVKEKTGITLKTKGQRSAMRYFVE